MSVFVRIPWRLLIQANTRSNTDATIEYKVNTHTGTESYCKRQSCNGATRSMNSCSVNTHQLVSRLNALIPFLADTNTNGTNATIHFDTGDNTNTNVLIKVVLIQRNSIP